MKLFLSVRSVKLNSKSIFSGNLHKETYNDVEKLRGEMKDTNQN